MAITRLDTPTKANDGTIGNAGIYNYPSGSNRMTVLVVSSESNDESGDVSAVTETDGSKSFTKLHSTFAFGEIASIWALMEDDIPGDGVSNGITITGPTAGYTVYIFTLDSVEQTPTIDDTDGNTSVLDPESFGLTTSADGYALWVGTDQGASGGGSTTWTDDGIELIDDDQGSYQTYGAEAFPSGTSVTMTLTGAGNATRWAAVAIAAAAAAPGGDSAVPHVMHLEGLAA